MRHQDNSRPVGVFDSGVGGLTIARRIRDLLPAENLLYLADSDNAPYGDKSPEFIRQRSLKIADDLLQHDAKAIVVACNTATVSAIPELRSRFAIPIIGVEPGVKPATTMSKSKRIGVLATERTIQSVAFKQLSERFAGKAGIHFQPCPGLVEKIEQGELGSIETEKMLKTFIQPLLNKKVDTLVLGCTHYAFLIPLINKIAGEGICVINTATAVARQLERRLAESGLLNENEIPGETDLRFCSNDLRIGSLIEKLWGEPVTILPVDL